MSARWTTGQVMTLAPDAASQRAASGLAGPSSWSGWGTAGDLVWGQCAGSGKHPYQTVIDVSGPAYHCSCPSRKFPCKHALALLLNWANGMVPEQGQLAAFAQSWKAGRDARTARAGADTTAKPASVKNGAAAARRSRQRADRVAGGLAELRVWLRDQIRAGLSGTAAGGYRHLDAIAARMVDAQAPGVANTLRKIAAVPVSGEGWPGRLLAHYAQLHLLIRAHDQLDTLPADLAAVVRSRVGYSIRREEVLAGPGFSDLWQVLAVRDVPDPPVPARRLWLHGHRTRRFALLLLFALNGSFGANPDAALPPGTVLDADVHYYPGQPPLRAVLGARRGQTRSAGEPEGAGASAAMLAGWAAALAADPWLAECPVLLRGTPVPSGERWRLVDASGAALPLTGQEQSLWVLLAISGGHPVTVAGEWSPAGLTALTAWHNGVAVPL
jgi:SWIM zinc finger